ncbi:hypothetical protein K501DRAFT_265339 [Backusella circina FSU 941]|nr:hypothetical protein K501DRAFT_265339 [Backusella circina FSU 941]
MDVGCVDSNIMKNELGVEVRYILYLYNPLLLHLLELKEKQSFYSRVPLYYENISQGDDVLNNESFFQDILQELGNFFNSMFGEENYLSQESNVAVEQSASEAPANIKRAIFDMNGLYSEGVAPDPSSNEYYDTTQATNEVILQEQKEKMAFNLAMTFKNAARKKALSAGMPSRLSRLLEKRGYYKSHKRFTRSIKNLPIED